MRKIYIVRLKTEQRAQLEQCISSGLAPARKIRRAHILLKADVGHHAVGQALIDKEIAQALDCSAPTVQRVRRSFCCEGLEAAINRAPTTRSYQRALDGRAEAHLVALACREAPEGRSRWTIRLLADKMVELGHIDTLSRETVRRTLKKTNFSPTARSIG